MKRKPLKSRFGAVVICMVLMLCVFSAQLPVRAGQTVITKIYSLSKTITVNRDNNNSLSLPAKLLCKLDTGSSSQLAVKWVCDDYRSYKPGTYIFTAVLQDSSYVFQDPSMAQVTVNNVIDTAFNTNTTRKYYFDHESDLRDFSCYFTEIGSTVDDYMNVNLVGKNIADYWTVANGMVVSKGYRTPDTTVWNGVNRARDVSTVLLNGFDFYNFRLEVEYSHGYDWWYPYVLFGVQDPSVFYGKVYAPQGANTSTGDGTDLHYDNNTLKGGIYAAIEQQGVLSFYGAIKADGFGRLFFDSDLSEGKTVFSNYLSTKKHSLKITVVDGTVAIQLDDSDIFYAEIDDEAIGGLVGFASCGNGVAYDNFTITALDKNGNEVNFEDAERGLAPTLKTDNYNGWNSAKRPWTYNWILGYDQTK